MNKFLIPLLANRDGSFHTAFMSNADVHVTIEHMGVTLEKYSYSHILR